MIAEPSRLKDSVHAGAPFAIRLRYDSKRVALPGGRCRPTRIAAQVARECLMRASRRIRGYFEVSLMNYRTVRLLIWSSLLLAAGPSTLTALESRQEPRSQRGTPSEAPPNRATQPADGSAPAAPPQDRRPASRRTEAHWYPHAVNRERGGFHQSMARDWSLRR